MEKGLLIQLDNRSPVVEGNYGINGIPAILLSRDGELLDTLIGNNQLAESLKKVL
jgi:thioredoxin-like negative regulator of GroEL